MMDQAVYDLARRAGIAIEWLDYAERPHRVSLDTIRHILTALGLPCETADDLAQSRQQLDMRAPPSVLTATTHQPVHVPCGSDAPSRLRITYEDGAVADIAAEQAAHGFILPPIAKAGYHRINLGPNRLTLAVAPARCVTIADVTGGERVWGLAVQTYGLRSAGECGIGDMAGVVALAKAAAALKADALALSPTHALFAADPNHFSPYSPSNRIFYNPLHADAATIFGEGRVAKAQSAAAANDSSTQDEASLIDWPRASRMKMAMFRRLFEDLSPVTFRALHLPPCIRISLNSARTRERRLPDMPCLKRCTAPDCGLTHATGVGRTGRRNCAIHPADRFAILPQRTSMRFFSTPSCNGSRTALSVPRSKTSPKRACASASSPILRSA